MATANGKCLLIDAATPLIQAIVFDGDGVRSSKAIIGNAVDCISALTKELMAEAAVELGDFDAMVYCNGPGSAMGLRAALISIKIWMIFSQRPLKLLEYSSLDMCLHLNRGASGALTGGAGDYSTIKARNATDVETIGANGDGLRREGIVFLDTRRTRGEKYTDFATADYAIAKGSFPIWSICHESNGELKDYGSGAYKKWDGVAIGGKRNRAHGEK